MYRHFFKRILDFCISMVGIILLSPLLLVITVWLHFANKGAGPGCTGGYSMLSNSKP